MKNAATAEKKKKRAKMKSNKINVFGGGLAGCEAAYQIAKRGIAVDL